MSNDEIVIEKVGSKLHRVGSSGCTLTLDPIDSHAAGVEYCGILKSDNKTRVTGITKPKKIQRACSESENSGRLLLSVNDPHSLVRLPADVSAEVGVSLSYRGVLAYRAVKATEQSAQRILENSGPITIFIIGGRGFGLWTVSLARSILNKHDEKGQNRYVVADNSIEGDELLTAVRRNDMSWFDTIHWKHEAYELDIVNQTRLVCPAGLDIVIDFSGIKRVARRLDSLLNEGAVIVTVGNTKVWTETLPDFIEKSGRKNRRLSIESIGCGHEEGSLDHLKELVELIKRQKVLCPVIHQDSFKFRDGAEFDNVDDVFSTCKE